MEIFRRDLLEGARATQAGYGVWGSAEWGKQYLEVSSPRTLEKMSLQQEGIMGNKTGVVVRFHVVVDIFRGRESRSTGVRGRAVENDLTGAGLSKLKA